jgi:hypothetical protein
MNQQITETIVTGMTKGELAAVICATIIIIGTAIAILSYVMNLHLKPLKNVPNQLTELNSKVKSGNELNLMMDNKILYHEKNCLKHSKQE